MVSPTKDKAETASLMPRFFFHIIDGDRIIEDPEGTELEDLDAARVEALHSARQLLAERLKAGDLVDGQVFEIRNEHGQLLAIVPFRDAVRFS
jgi:hypothetical protein